MCYYKKRTYVRITRAQIISGKYNNVEGTGNQYEESDSNGDDSV